MLRLIPRPAHRTLYRGAHFLRRKWLGLRGGVVNGCSIVARDGEGRVLLVRHSYGKGRWAFPGGGMREGEDPFLAARREFSEELGCVVADLALLGVMEEPYHGATNRVHVFSARSVGTPQPDGRELIAAEFFALDALPAELSRTVAARLSLLG